MSSPTRFLLLLVTGWVGVRAAMLGLFPAGGTPAAAALPVLPPPAETQLTPPDGYWQLPAPAPTFPTGALAPQPWPFPVPVYQPVPVRAATYAPARSEPVWSLPPPRTGGPMSLAQAPAIPEWPELAAGPVRAPSTPLVAQPAGPPRFDRFQVATWATMRDRPGSQGIAGTGTLGGSQAGVRVLYRFDPRLAASVRATAPLGTARRGGDVAVGVRYSPFPNIPVAVTIERRQGFGEMGGPTGFAFLGEGGLYRHFGGFRLDSYLQAGMIVGKDGRLAFIDGAGVVTRPVWRNIELGAGVWGARQPGLSRLDVGPRLSLKVARGIRAHADYRLNVAGNAAPGSGAVVTLAGDF